MQVANNENELLNIKDNLVLGSLPKMNNSKIIFYGENNILYCEDSVTLSDSVLEFGASNSIVFLRSSSHKYRLLATVFNNSTIYIDKDNYFNEPLDIIVSEETNLVIGRDSMFSKGVSIMTTDHHPIYDVNTLERINHAKSIYIGDHVWIGQDSTILKGTKIDSGSIIGASSVVAGSSIPNNTIYAGNPAKLIKEDAFWNGASTHKWIRGVENSSSYEGNPEDYKFNLDDSERLDYADIEGYLNRCNSKEKYEFLQILSKNSRKNRFVHFAKEKNKVKKFNE